MSLNAGRKAEIIKSYATNEGRHWIARSAGRNPL